jgi:hypothetical protein
MSSATAPTTPQHPDIGSRASDRFVVYRHSNLFYWWPLWFLGFAFAAFTYFEDKHLAIVPANTVAAENRDVDVDGKGTMEKRDVLILEKGKPLWKRTNPETGQPEIVQPDIYVTDFRSIGTIYVILLLFVTTITSVTIRGLWTVFVFVVITAIVVIFAAAGWWDWIFLRLRQLSIHINMGAYLLIATVLVILWMVNFFFLDRQTYMVFTPGQVRVRLEIGGEETVYDTTGMVVMKQRADLFRHWILGFGSGDLIIKPVGLPNPLEFPNVLFVGSKTTHIERMVKEKVIVRPDPAPPT